MEITWMAIRKNKDKKFENQILRKKEMPYEAALKEIHLALGKLEYKVLNSHEQSISFYKYCAKETEDIFSIIIVGDKEEIIAVRNDKIFKKFMK